MTILDKIIETKLKEVKVLKQNFTYSDFENAPFFDHPSRSLTQSLKSKHFGIIAEIKRKSPSAGVINPDLNILDQADLYHQAGVSGISCLTDYHFFGGKIEDLLLLKSHSTIPLLRKEFIVDELQLFEAKANGADAVLLISEILNKQQILQFTIIAQSLGMEVILELHNKTELDKINDLVDIIGINNRDLKVQRTNIQNSFEMIHYLPKDKVLISESGIKTTEELLQLKENGYHGALIGESLLKNDDPVSFLNTFKQKNQVIC